jgi:hypothetical protein
MLLKDLIPQPLLLKEKGRIQSISSPSPSGEGFRVRSKNTSFLL